MHGKGSLLNKMSGDDWQKFANLRAYYGFMWGYPGKKLLFMGQEFAQRREWSEARALDWDLLDHRAAPRRAGAGARPQPPLPRARRRCTRATASRDGFAWLIVDDSENSVFAWLRKAPGAAAGRGHLQFHAGAARRLRRAAAVGRPLARDHQHRRRRSMAASRQGQPGRRRVDAVAGGWTAGAVCDMLTLPPLSTIMA